MPVVAKTTIEIVLIQQTTGTTTNKLLVPSSALVRVATGIFEPCPGVDPS
jgi:hypothetical protein